MLVLSAFRFTKALFNSKCSEVMERSNIFLTVTNETNAQGGVIKHPMFVTLLKRQLILIETGFYI